MNSPRVPAIELVQKLIRVLARLESVIPLRQDAVFSQTKLAHLFVGYFDTGHRGDQHCRSLRWRCRSRQRRSLGSEFMLSRCRSTSDGYVRSRPAWCASPSRLSLEKRRHVDNTIPMACETCCCASIFIRHPPAHRCQPVRWPSWLTAPPLGQLWLGELRRIGAR